SGGRAATVSTALTSPTSLVPGHQRGRSRAEECPLTRPIRGDGRAVGAGLVLAEVVAVADLDVGARLPVVLRRLRLGPVDVAGLLGPVPVVLAEAEERVA